MYRIAVDAMGGDRAPDITVAGSLEALRTFEDIRILLIGQEEKIRPLLAEPSVPADRIEVIDAREMILNTESPVMAVRRKTDSSMVKGLQLVREGQADAFVSAGSTGALLVGGILRVGRIEGVERPALAALLPNVKGGLTLLADTGANVDCRPQWLVQFAQMGAAYAHKVLGIERPTVSLLNIGEEDEKGNALTKATAELLRGGSFGFDFIGNVESRAMFDGLTDVIVSDGFHGNLSIKAAEGMASVIFSQLKGELTATRATKVGALLCRKAFHRIKKKLSAEEIGGAPLLGVEGAVIKAHGNSSAHAFFCALRQARKMLEGHIREEIRGEIRSAQAAAQAAAPQEGANA